MTQSDDEEIPDSANEERIFANPNRAQVILEPMMRVPVEPLRELLRPGQYARFEEVMAHLMAIGEGHIKTCPDIRTSILECLDSLDERQLKSDETQRFAKMLSTVLYECSSTGLTQRVANAKGKWSARE